MAADNTQRNPTPQKNDANGVDLRFRLHKAQGIVKIYGALDATTTVELLEDMRDSDMILDLSEIKSASWGGIVKFYKYLLGFGAAIKLRGIPAHLFRSLRLLVDKSDPVTIEEAEIEVFDPLDSKKPIEKRRQAINDLERLAIAQGPIITVAPGKQVLGIAEYICPRYFQSRGAPAPEFANSWCKGHPAESLFWFNLGHVLSTAFVLGSDLIESSRRNMNASLADLTTLFKALRIAEKALTATGRQIDDQRVVRELNSLNQQIINFNHVCSGIEGHCSLALKDLQIATWGPNIANPESILKALHELVFAANSQALVPPEVASLLSHLDLHADKEIGSEMLTKLKACNDKNVLAEVRDAFNIMSMDDTLDHTDELVMDIELELVALREHLRLARTHVAAVKAGQTLLRRWQADVQYIKACLSGVKAETTAWSELRDGLFAQWRARDMTPEEVKIYSFYFPDALYLGELIIDGNASSIIDQADGGIDLDQLLNADFKIDSAD